LIGFTLAGGCVLAVYEIWLNPSSPANVPALPASSGIAAPAKPGNDAAPEGESRRALPETTLPDAYFKLTAKSHTDISMPAGNEKLDAGLEFKYAHDKTNDGILLTVYSMDMSMSRGGVFVEHTLMTRDKFVQQQGDQKTESPFDELPPDQQQAMAAAFGTNFCKITLDADQNEQGRQVFSEAGSALINEGNLNTLRLMHGPYHHGVDRWQGVKRIPMTAGLVLDCPLEYVKTGGPGSEIDVTGSLSKEEVDSPQADMAIKNVSCSISGKEFFDENLEDYTSGEITFRYKFQVFQKGVQAQTLDGNVLLSLERVTATGK